MKRVYLDYNATTPICADALDAYVQAVAFCGNSSSIHLDGQAARHRLEEAREGLAKLWKTAPQEIIFTSGATESNNLAIKGAARHAARAGKRHVLVSAAEHSSALDAAFALGPENFEVETVPVGRDGRVTAGELEKRIRPETALAVVMAVNNETGVVQPYDEMIRVCAEHGVPLHIDWVQGLGKIPIRLDGCATASFSAHKAYGPKGAGALYVARKSKLAALTHGGPQENNLRAGTASPELALAMLAAARFAEREREKDEARLTEFKEHFLNELSAQSDGWILNAPSEITLPQTISLRFEGADGNALVTAMDLAGFSLSSGSACAAGSVEASHVLTAMGLAPEEARGAVRISFGHFTQRDELTRCAQALAREAARLKDRP